MLTLHCSRSSLTGEQRFKQQNWPAIKGFEVLSTGKVGLVGHPSKQSTPASITKSVLISMRLSTSLIFLGALHTTWGSALLDFSAARGDSPSILGIRDLEAARGVTVSSNTPDLYIELGTDPSGVAALHCHRAAGDIRTEYHALSGRMEANQIYYIGYQFSLAEIEQSLMIWQLYVFTVSSHEKPGCGWLTHEHQ